MLFGIADITTKYNGTQNIHCTDYVGFARSVWTIYYG